MSLQSVLESGAFAVTAEVGPLKGTDVTELMAVAQLLLGKVTAVNVTDQQSSVMRLAATRPRSPVQLNPAAARWQAGNGAAAKTHGLLPPEYLY